ncbi:Phage shock protein PspC (stress-responsive transcriptional regulator) [Spirosomataceae bacterium TFI 002]|nr:Phage shock protein PspC (stress-responsive transcriptional regulator) [Spirosomataceae bacterium TFI 002]
MKKTVQINIAGILFNIEEDAYSKLSTYLKSIQHYFSAFESSDEIVADIESRIAEKFLGKGDAEKLIVKLSDVDAVITRMGSVEDFEALEEEVDFREDAQPKEEKKEEFAAAASQDPKSKRLFRDTKRKALGGVLAGLAHYFQFDVTWIRVIFILLFIGITPITETGASGFLLIAYIICWIAFPPNDQLEDNSKIKKFYRNPDKKVLVGVASGLSAYFNVDVALIRILFVVFSGIGIGVIAYLALWIGAPYADSLTRKMEMKGEPVTLENIENSIRKSQGITNEKEENTITKILLFPFRVISMIFGALGNLLRHLGPVARVVAGLFLAFIGIAMLFASLGVTTAFFGITSNAHLFDLPRNVGMLFGEVPKAGGIFLFLATLFPGLAATLGGFSLISNQRVGTRNFWLTALALWVIGIFGLAMYGGTYAMNFNKRDVVTEEITLNTTSNKLFFEVNGDNFYNDDFDFDIDLDFEESTNGNIEIVKRLEARGSSTKQARENAENIIYNIVQKGDTIVFDSDLSLKNDQPFRNQQVRLLVRIPKGTQFGLSENFVSRLFGQQRSMMYKYGLNRSKLNEIVYIMDDKGELSCVDCPALSDVERDALDRNYGNDYDVADRDYQQRAPYRQTYNFKDFDSIELSGSFQAIITQADSFSVEVVADRDRDLSDVDVDKDGSRLSFEFTDNFFTDRDRVVVFITMPDIKDLDLSGASRIKVLNYENSGKMNVELSGASVAALDLEIDNLNMEINGASRAELIGRVSKLDLDVSGASRAETKRCIITTANVESSGASRVTLGKVTNLTSDSSGASRISRE